MKKETMNDAWHTPDFTPYGDDFHQDPNQNDPGNHPNNKRRKILIVVLSVSLGVLALASAALGVLGWMKYNGVNLPLPFDPTATEPTKPFTFEANTLVSGIDIGGMTVPQAKIYLEKNKKQLTKPINIDLHIEDNETQLTQDDFEYTYDIDDVVDQIKADIDAERSTVETVYTVTSTVKDSSVDKKVNSLSEEYNVAPSNARVSEFYPYAKNRFAYESEQVGYEIDEEDLTRQLHAALCGKLEEVMLEVATEKLEPTVTEEFLRKNIVKLSSYQTYSTNTSNATNNMKVSLKSCNGSILEPGEVWSFNDCTGDSNLEANGYKSAHVIYQGKLINGIGGGICQSSSTIYNAAIRANLKIEERYNHKWASSYVPTGLDATIDYPYLDLKLSNPTDYQMFLECKVVDSTLYASFWGVKTGDYDEIKTRNQQGEKGSDSYGVRAWRVYYKDGKKISEEELPYSSYDLEHGIVFHSAENDSRAVDTNVDEPNNQGAPEPTKATEPPETTAAPPETEPTDVTEATEPSKTE